MGFEGVEFLGLGGGELIAAQAQKLDTLKTHNKRIMQQRLRSGDEVAG